MNFAPFWVFYPVFFCINSLFAQAQNGQDTVKPPARFSFLQKAQSPQKARIWGVSGGILTAYTGASLGLHYVWYAQYPRQPFHLFNDWQGWRGMDKAGHAFTAYFEAEMVSDLYQWAGLRPKKAALLGATAGLLFQATLETMDAFSAGWGWSWGDMGFNTLGAGLYYTQAQLWGEQRARIKLSFHSPRYSQAVVQAQNSNATSSAAARAAALFGESPPHQLLKEYNGQTLWLSVNPAAFWGKKSPSKWGKIANFTNIALGYSVENLLGAEKNQWRDKNGNLFAIPPQQMPRYSQLFLSLDIDWVRIPSRRAWVKTLLKALNFVKIPFPTLEFNTLGQLKAHWLYF